MVKDPVCGMTIDEKKAAGQSEFKGSLFFFCSLNCQETFESDPHKYLNRVGKNVKE